MNSIDERLLRLEGLVDRLQRSLAERLAALEAAAQAAAAPRKRGPIAGFISWAGSELPKFVFAAALLYLGWQFKDSVDLAIKQRQIDLSYAQQMQGLLQKMAEPNASMAQLESAAAVLSIYGDAALPLLMGELRYTGLRANAAYTGLQSLALSRADTVCETLPSILASRAQQYDWQAHKSVVHLLGANSCAKALPALRSYRNLVDAAVKGKDAELLVYLSAPPRAPAEDYPLLLETVDKVLRQLDGGTSAAKGGSR
jgi:multidrug efflux pump subunit AcrA (membrane-fusion protein)